MVTEFLKKYILKKYIAVSYHFDVAIFDILIDFKWFIDTMFYLIVRRYTWHFFVVKRNRNLFW